MTQRTRAEMLTYILAQLPTNNQNQITAAMLRDVLDDIVDSVTIWFDEDVDTDEIAEKAVTLAKLSDAVQALLNPFTGATGSADGTIGLVTKPLIANSAQFLRGDGQWATPPSASGVIGVTSNLGLSASIGANALTISMVDASGAAPSVGSPVSIPFRSATAASGLIFQRTVTAPLDLVVPAGATLGTANNVPFRLWITAFDDGGTIRIGVIKTLSGLSIYPLKRFALVSSTAMSGVANSAQVFYTDSAVATKAYTILGYMEWASGLATAGTWNALPTRIETYRVGDPLPGDIIQTVALNIAAGSSTSSGTFQDVTGATLTITPDSTVNAIDAFFEASSFTQAGGAGTNTTAITTMLRNTTDLGTTKTVGVVSGSGTNMQSNAAVTHSYRDFPASVAATIYKLQHRQGSATANVTTAAISGKLMELMV